MRYTNARILLGASLLVATATAQAPAIPQSHGGGSYDKPTYSDAYGLSTAPSALPQGNVDYSMRALFLSQHGDFMNRRQRYTPDVELAARALPNQRVNNEPGSFDMLGYDLDATFRRGFARLAARGLTFDAWLFHPQIPELTDLAQAFPEASIILDHLGGPLGIGPYAGKRDEYFPKWRADMAGLATCPNVTVKLGGMAMPINGWDWHKTGAPDSAAFAAAQGDWYRAAIDLFGPHLYQLYGQGESPMTITGLPQSCHTAGAEAARLASCGHARTGVEVRIVDEEDRELPSGEVGEVITRSDCVSTINWKDRAKR